MQVFPTASCTTSENKENRMVGELQMGSFPNGHIRHVPIRAFQDDDDEDDDEEPLDEQREYQKNFFIDKRQVLKG